LRTSSPAADRLTSKAARKIIEAVCSLRNIQELAAFIAGGGPVRRRL
jgi:glycerate-2-kinase